MLNHLTRTGVLLGLLGAGLVFVGCDDTPEPEPPSRFVVDEDLPGSWRRTASWGSTTYEFGSNGTTVIDEQSDVGSRISEGHWTLTEGGSLTIETVMSGTLDGEPAVRTDQVTTIPAIVGDYFYPSVLYRTEGSGEGLEGSWAQVDAQRIDTEFNGGVRTTFYERDHTLSLEVTGDDLHLQDEETSADDDGNYFRDDRRRGTIRVEGDRVLAIYSEIDGHEVPEAEQVEEFVGYRLAEHVIFVEAAEGEAPTDFGYLRQ